MKNFAQFVESLNEDQEGRKIKRAGLIPYIIQDGQIEMLFMIPSDPAYGGDQFQIAKGRVEEDVDIEHAALREAEEELGLVRDNIKKVDLVEKFLISGLDGYPYEFYLYVVEVIEKDNFQEYHYETGETAWLTLEEYQEQGRESQLDLVEKAYQFITQ